MPLGGWEKKDGQGRKPSLPSMGGEEEGEAQVKKDFEKTKKKTHSLLGVRGNIK